MGLVFALQLLLKDLSASIFLISFGTTVNGFMQAVSSPFWGMKSDRSRNTYRLYLLLLAVPFLLYPLLSLVSSVLLFLMIAGSAALFEGGFLPVGLDISMIFGDGRRDRINKHISIFHAAVALGNCLGRLSLGLMLKSSPTINIIYIAAAFGIASFLVGFAARPRKPKTILKTVESVSDRAESSSDTAVSASLPSDILMENPYTQESHFSTKIITRSHLWPVYIGALLINIPIMGFISLAAVYQMDRLGISASLSVLFAVMDPLGMFLMSLLITAFIQRRNTKSFLVLAFVSINTSLLLFRYSSSLYGLFLAWLLIGAATALYQSAGSACIAKRYDQHRSAEGIGLQWTASTIGIILGPIIAGSAAEFSYHVMFLILIVFSAAGLILMGTYRLRSV